MPDTGLIVGTLTGRAVVSACATRYHASPAAARPITIATETSMTDNHCVAGVRLVAVAFTG